jgi:hypothetical protein
MGRGFRFWKPRSPNSLIPVREALSATQERSKFMRFSFCSLTWLALGLGFLGTLIAVLKHPQQNDADVFGGICLDHPDRAGPIFVVVQVSTFLARTGGGWYQFFRFLPDTN